MNEVVMAARISKVDAAEITNDPVPHGIDVTGADVIRGNRPRRALERDDQTQRQARTTG